MHGLYRLRCQHAQNVVAAAVSRVISACFGSSALTAPLTDSLPEATQLAASRRVSTLLVPCVAHSPSLDLTYAVITDSAIRRPDASSCGARPLIPFQSLTCSSAPWSGSLRSCSRLSKVSRSPRAAVAWCPQPLSRLGRGGRHGSVRRERPQGCGWGRARRRR